MKQTILIPLLLTATMTYASENTLWYGKVDMFWFDHVGGQDWGKWRMDELFSMMYRLQPQMLVNERAAKFIGGGFKLLANI
jgi:alpha-L-fucosidase